MHVLAQEPPSIHLAEQKEKAELALSYSRRMTWDMVKVAVNKIESEEEVHRLPFAGLCCVLRAGIAVLETSGCVEEDIMLEEEMDGFQRIVGWFAGRYGVGRQFEARLVKLVK
jgi:hypothetical protein